MSIYLKVALVLGSIMVAFTATLTGASIILTERTLLELTRGELTAAIEVAGDFIGTKTSLLKADANTVASRVAAVSPDKLQETLQQAQANYPDFMAFTVFDREGVLATWGEPAPVSYFPENSEYLQKAFRGETVVSTTRKKGEKLVIHLCTPIDKKRVLSVTINGLVFQDLLGGFKLWNSGKLFLLDEYGTTIASPTPEHVKTRHNIHSPDPSMAKWHATLLKAILSKEGLGEYNDDHRKALFAWRTLTGSTEGWVVGVFAPIQDSPVAKGKKMLFLAAAIFMAAGFFIVFIFSRYLARPFILIKEQNKNLKELNEDMAAANEAKSHFLANMSHEMRTPLNVVIGLAELTLNSKGSSYREECIENLEKILNASTTLLNIINDILDVSKISSGKFEIVPASYNLASLINDVVAQNMILIVDKPIEVKLRVDPGIPSRLFGDNLRVKQIFNNLISNAFKYTYAGTVSLDFTFELEENEDIWLIFSIKDTGIGIRAENLEKIFVNYVQVDTNATRRIEGTGLGLALAKQLVELMDGSISVESEYGFGSTFKTRIRQKHIGNIPIGEEVVESLAQFRFDRAKLYRNSNLPRVSLPDAKVLIVDDVSTNLDVARGLMKPYCMQIDCVRSGQAAVKLVREARVKYDAIFMDHMMPQMDGVEAVRIIREEIGTDYAKEVPIIALTANAVVGTEEMFLQNGFQAFVSKPIDIMQLDLVIRQWIQNKDFQEGVPLQAALARKNPSPQNPCSGHRQEKKLNTTDIVPAWIKGGIDGLNMGKILSIYGRNMENYLKIINSYIRYTPSLLDSIRKISPTDLDSYATTVHGIKGSSYNVCADAVGDMALTLEKAAKAGDFVFVQTHNLPFLEAVEKLLAAISKKLQAYFGPKSVRNEPDSVALEVLRQACETFDIDQVGQAMDLLNAYEYSPGDGADLVAWLEEKVFVLDFKKIAERLAERKLF